MLTLPPSQAGPSAVDGMTRCISAGNQNSPRPLAVAFSHDHFGVSGMATQSHQQHGQGRIVSLAGGDFKGPLGARCYGSTHKI